MFNYIYDGTFEGLLTCIYDAINKKHDPVAIVCSNSSQQSLIYQDLNVTSDIEKAKKVYESIKLKISPTSAKKVYYTYLSDYENAGIWIYEYLKLGWKMGSKIDNHLADDRVLRVHKTSIKVLGESHRILGLLRFQEIHPGIFYAPIEPDHNILRLIAPHFARRFSDQNWIIHDIKRGLTAVYDQKHYIFKKTAFRGEFSKTKHEVNYQDMWKKYFKKIAIKNRINPKLQKRNMPVRYWKHLVEMKPD